MRDTKYSSVMLKITDNGSIFCPEACRLTAFRIFMLERVAVDPTIIYLNEMYNTFTETFSARNQP